MNGSDRTAGGATDADGPREDDSDRAGSTSARLRWVAVLLVGAIIGVASVVSAPGGVGSAGPLGVVGADKWFHAAGYAALALALAAALDGRDRIRTAATAAAVAVAYGAAIELVQGPLPTRAYDPIDLAANAVGAIVAALGWWALNRRCES